MSPGWISSVLRIITGSILRPSGRMRVEGTKPLHGKRRGTAWIRLNEINKENDQPERADLEGCSPPPVAIDGGIGSHQQADPEQDRRGRGDAENDR